MSTPEDSTGDIAGNLARLQRRIAEACEAWGRDPAELGLVAVSKTFPAEAVRAAVAAGQRAFGENYLQDALPKLHALSRDGATPGPLVWHFIGRLQSNKTREVAEHFQWVHSVDRFKLARRLSEQRPESAPPLDVCLQVDLSGEPGKGGVAPGTLRELALQVAELPRLRLRGLMTLPEPTADFEAQRVPFRRLAGLRTELAAEGLDLDTLSMGMSADLEAAIAEGATLLRVGTAIFGRRHPASG